MFFFSFFVSDGIMNREKTFYSISVNRIHPLHKLLLGILFLDLLSMAVSSSLSLLFQTKIKTTTRLSVAYGHAFFCLCDTHSNILQKPSIWWNIRSFPESLYLCKNITLIFELNLKLRCAKLLAKIIRTLYTTRLW